MASLGSARYLMFADNEAAVAVSGYFSDALLALLLFGCLSLANRFVAVVLLILFWAYQVVNLEMAAALGRVLYFQEISAGLDAGFITNSLQDIVFPAYAFGGSLVTAIVCWRWLVAPQIITTGSKIASVVFGVAGLSVTATADYRSSSPLVISAQSLVHWQTGDEDLSVNGFGTAPGLEIVDHARGESLLRARPQHINVILLVLEGAGGHAIRSNAEHYTISSSLVMPNLSRLAESGLNTRNMFNHGHQTIRGLYAMLCADYSSFGFEVFKADEYIALPEQMRPACLPQLLAEAGYQTTFIQAADLSYMSKDRFMPAIGFQQVQGRSEFEYSYVDHPWGPDDKAFLEQAVDKILALRNQHEPFFVTLLTVGTHHPFTIPGEAKVEELSRRDQAFMYLDDAIGNFEKSLSEQGLLENTLLLITSDESRPARERLATANWSPLIAVGPGVEKSTQREIRGLIDVPVSILDYLGLTEHLSNTMPGYSVFRNYQQTRGILFSSINEHYLVDKKRLIHCTAYESCSAMDLDRGDIFVAKPKPASISPDPSGKRLKLIHQHSDGTLRRGLRRINLDSQSITVKPKEKASVLEGRYLSVKQSERVSVDIVLVHQGGEQLRIVHRLIEADSGKQLSKEKEVLYINEGQSLKIEYLSDAISSWTLVYPSVRAYTRHGAAKLDIRSLDVRVESKNLN